MTKEHDVSDSVLRSPPINKDKAKESARQLSELAMQLQNMPTPPVDANEVKSNRSRQLLAPDQLKTRNKTLNLHTILQTNESVSKELTDEPTSADKKEVTSILKKSKHTI